MSLHCWCQLVVECLLHRCCVWLVSRAKFRAAHCLLSSQGLVLEVLELGDLRIAEPYVL